MLAHGHLEILGKLYDLLARDLYGYIRSIVGSPADAEDVFQEAFARLAAQKDKLLRVERPICYVFAIARNEAFKVLKKRARGETVSLDGALAYLAAGSAPEAPALSPREVAAALATLPPEQREVVVLKIYEGFTFAEIADLTNVSPNTAASRYRYALAKLAHKFGRAAGRV